MNEFENTPKPKNSNSKKIRSLLAVFFLLIIGAGVSLYAIYGIITDDNSRSLFEDPRNTTGANPTIQIENTDNPVATVNTNTIVYNGKTYSKNVNIVNLLFLGIDYTVDRAALNLGYRSDMTMICAVDTANKKITLISFPRDTYTTVYHIDPNTGKVEFFDQDRVNAAYSFGGGPNHYGAQNSMACVEMFLQRENKLKTKLDFTLDIPVFHYVSMDIDGIAPVATAIGGVEVTLEDTIPGVGRKGQTLTLKGEKAETYIRDRHNTTGGDFGRADKEQVFMIKLAKKIKDMGAVSAVTNLYNELQKYFLTDLNLTQMKDFAKILTNVNIDSIQTLTVPGHGDSSSGPYFYKENAQEEEQMLQLLLSVYYTEAS